MKRTKSSRHDAFPRIGYTESANCYQIVIFAASAALLLRDIIAVDPHPHGSGAPFDIDAALPPNPVTATFLETALSQNRTLIVCETYYTVSAHLHRSTDLLRNIRR